MKAIDPHIHMVSRTTDDYLKMAISGIHTVAEPAFWAGFDRSSADSFRDYFHQLTVTEPARAARFGIRHYCWIGLNSKESENLKLAEDVLAIMPEYIDRPTALGIGEVGLNKNSRNEIAVLEKQLALAAERNELILIHTPHLEDKLKGTRIIMDIIRADAQNRSGSRADRSRRGTYDRRDQGPWFLVRADPVSEFQRQSRAGDRRRRNLRHRPDLHQFLGRLECQRSAVGSQVRERNASPRTSGAFGQSGLLRESQELPWPMSKIPGRLITYCSNIHPGDSWAETFTALRQHVPAVKAAVSPEQPFPIGLRLSQRAAVELTTGENRRFTDWLRENDCFVPTVNGFPYGSFHGERVKEQVYLPDWRRPERAAYTICLADLLAGWLPEGMTGSISTVPVGLKGGFSEQDLTAMPDNRSSPCSAICRRCAGTGEWGSSSPWNRNPDACWKPPTRSATSLPRSLCRPTCVT
jgi:hypothetical protein